MLSVQNSHVVWIADAHREDYKEVKYMDNCPCCGSKNVEHVTRVTGFFSKVEGWNKGKIGELNDRKARDNGHFAI